jgi:hypothetical protein
MAFNVQGAGGSEAPSTAPRASPADALAALVGTPVSGGRHLEADQMTSMREAVASGRSAVACTRGDAAIARAAGLAPGHAYSVVGIRSSTVVLYGRGERVRLDWSQFQASMSGVWWN